MKVSFKVYELSFPHGLHLNKGRQNTEDTELFLHSDGLLAALMQVYSQWGQNPEDLKELVLSSAYPFRRDGQQASYYFPKMFFPKIEGHEEEAGFSKKLKKINWLDHSSLEDLANGKFQFQCSKLQDSYYSDAASPEIISSVRLRSRVGRMEEEDTIPYYIDELYFGVDSGLFFLTQDLSDAQAKALTAALKMLQDSGIGTDRSVGKGNFTFRESSLNLELPDEARYATNLGLFLPADEKEWEALNSNGNQRYELIIRGGWFDGGSAFLGRRKNSVNMIREGGLWAAPDSSKVCVKGRLADLAPKSLNDEGLNHPVWRSGRSLFIPLKIEDYEL